MRNIVVVHREAMVAEGLAAALARYTNIRPIGIATTAEGAVERGREADAVAIYDGLAGAQIAATRLRRKGIRVVMMGDQPANDDELHVSTRAPVSTLAYALAPHAHSRGRRRELTPREQEILELVGRGMSAKQVANRLEISPKTVEQHKSRIFNKLGVPNSTAAVLLALSQASGRTY
jgi:DNA-binding NarL/FixJ family response regulator